MGGALAAVSAKTCEDSSFTTATAHRRSNYERRCESSWGVPGALCHAESLLEIILREVPPLELKALLERVFSGRGLYLYAH